MESGFLFINKDEGITSQSLDNLVKKKFNVNKVGHLGTLDPLASGLIIIGVMNATRYFKYFNESRKTYILRLRVGSTTPSLDNETEVTESVDCDLRGKEDYIDNELSKFPLVYEQYPPLYSAVKVSGVPLYKYAYKEKEVIIKPRLTEIYSLKRISDIELINNNSYFDIEIECKSGFYVRSFAKDFSNKIGYPGMADKIIRTKVDDFDISQSKNINDINESDFVDPLTLLNFKRIEIDDDRLKYILNGSKYYLKERIDDEYIILTNKNIDIAIYKKELNNKYKMDLLIKQ